MDVQLEFEGTLYSRMGDNWFDAETFVRVPRALARKLDTHLRASQESVQSKRKTTGTGAGREASTFRHADTFPIIAGLIRKACRDRNAFVGHQDIVAAFLADPAGRSLAEAAAEQQGKAVEQVASNVVAWFSKRFTEGETPYQDLFERERVGGRWAYRLVE